MNSKQLISRNIEVFYNNASEETRLEKGMGVFEFERIKILIEKYLPIGTSKIIDIGGGVQGNMQHGLRKRDTTFIS